MKSLNLRSVGAMFSFVVGVALSKMAVDPGYKGRMPYIPTCRAEKRHLRSRKERLNTYTRNLVIYTVDRKRETYYPSYMAAKG